VGKRLVTEATTGADRGRGKPRNGPSPWIVLEKEIRIQGKMFLKKFILS
jgi:hypothetical protein